MNGSNKYLDNLHKLMKMSIKPDIKSYHIIAKTFLENNESEMLRDLLESMEYTHIELDWKMYGIAQQSMVSEKCDISWASIQQYLASVIAAKKVFPRQPMIDDVLQASMELNALIEGIHFV